MPSLSLEDFGQTLTDPRPSAAAKAPEPLTEADRVASYEQGYQAGWNDATKAEAQDQARIGADFARTLQELSFTFHEARAHVIKAMEPFMTELTDVLLPGLVSETFAQRVLEELMPLIEDCADTPVDLAVAPGSLPALERQMQEISTVAIRLAAEPSLAEGQAYLRIGKIERQIDMSDALDRIRTAIQTLYELNERTLKHA